MLTFIALHFKAVLPFVNSLTNIPSSLQEKWIKFVKMDAKAVLPSNKLLPSLSYRSIDAPAKHASNTVSRACSDAVRNACVKVGFDDVKTSKVTSLLNPLEGDEAKHLQALYAKLLISDLKKDIVSDPNYLLEPARFPNLQAALL